MKKLDRLCGILLALQQGPLTAAALAERFEVVVRTVIRDIQALSEMGVPVCSAPGPGGGYRLMEGFRLPPLRLDVREALAVLFALRATQAYADTPFNAERWTVADKLREMLPEETRRNVDHLLAGFSFNAPRRRPKTPLLAELTERAAAGGWVRADYQSQSGRKTVLLRSLRIHAENGFWYCEALSHTHGEERTFRVDRILALSQADPPEDPPPPAKAEYPSLAIEVRLTYRGMLQVERDPHLGEHLVQATDDRWLLACSLPKSELDWLARYFMSLGEEAEVMAPAELRWEIGRRAEAIRRRYADDNQK